VPVRTRRFVTWKIGPVSPFPAIPSGLPDRATLNPWRKVPSGRTVQPRLSSIIGSLHDAWYTAYTIHTLPCEYGVACEVSMLVQQGRTVARQWVTDEASTLPGFHSAYLAGSTNWLPDDAPLPATSDLDINVVLHRPHAASTRGKFVYQGVLLEVTLLSPEQIRSPELILSDYHLAGGLRTPGILLDPTGQLTQIQTAVARLHQTPLGSTTVRTRQEQGVGTA